MSLLSLEFFIFFLMCLIIYYVLPGCMQWIWLLAVSVYFYVNNASVASSAIFIIFLIINWGLTNLFTSHDKFKKRIYILLLSFDIVFLTLFKYTGFILDVIHSLTGMSMQAVVPLTDSLAKFEPPHISYFVLITIAYITDVYYDKCKPQKNLLKYVLFNSYFPIMTSGPIIRYGEMENGLFGEKKRFSYEKVIRGLERVLWGAFKKLVMAQRCAVIANEIYDKYQIYPGIYIFLGVMVFAFQLYTDFSGLIDIVLGVSECLGIDLPENFRTPFFSRSIAEFWRRWHITLGAFLKDYVLFSLQRGKLYKKLRNVCKKYLGKDYKKKYNIPAYLTMFVSWFIIGLWHGGGWNYIFGVGIYMWLIIIVSDMLKPVFEKVINSLKINTECESYHLFQQIRTFWIYLFGVSFFRAESMSEGIALWKSAFSCFNPWILFDESLYNLGLDRREFGIMVLGLLLVLVVSYITEKENMDIRDWMRKQNFVFRVVIYNIIFAITIIYGQYGQVISAADFIYGKF